MVKREQVVATYSMMRDPWGDWWIGILADGKPHDKLGPFRTREECNSAYTDLLTLAQLLGAAPQPTRGH